MARDQGRMGGRQAGIPTSEPSLQVRRCSGRPPMILTPRRPFLPPRRWTETMRPDEGRPTINLVVQTEESGTLEGEKIACVRGRARAESKIFC